MPRRRVNGGVKGGVRRIPQIVADYGAAAADRMGFKPYLPEFDRPSGTYTIIFQDKASGKLFRTAPIKRADIIRIAGLTTSDPKGRAYEFQDIEKGSSALAHLFETRIRERIPRGEAAAATSEELPATSSATVASTSSPATPAELRAPAPEKKPRETPPAASIDPAARARKEAAATVAMEKIQRAAEGTPREEAAAAEVLEQAGEIPSTTSRRIASEKASGREAEAVNLLEELSQKEKEEPPAAEEEPIHAREYRVDLPYDPETEEWEVETPSATKSKRTPVIYDPSSELRAAEGVAMIDEHGEEVGPQELSEAQIAGDLARGSEAIAFRRAPLSADDRAEGRLRVIGSILELTREGDINVANQMEIITRAQTGHLTARELHDLGTNVLRARQDKLRRLAQKGFKTLTRDQLKKILSRL